MEKRKRGRGLEKRKVIEGKEEEREKGKRRKRGEKVFFFGHLT